MSRPTIDVKEFLERDDIPEEAKDRVRKVGKLKTKHPTVQEKAHAYRLMQAQCLIELFRLGEDVRELERMMELEDPRGTLEEPEEGEE